MFPAISLLQHCPGTEHVVEPVAELSERLTLLQLLLLQMTLRPRAHTNF